MSLFDDDDDDMLFAVAVELLKLAPQTVIELLEDTKRKEQLD